MGTHLSTGLVAEVLRRKFGFVGTLGTHLRVLSEIYPMNTNTTGFRRFSLLPCALDESSLSIGRRVVGYVLIHISPNTSLAMFLPGRSHQKFRLLLAAVGTNGLK